MERFIEPLDKVCMFFVCLCFFVECPTSGFYDSQNSEGAHTRRGEKNIKILFRGPS